MTINMIRNIILHNILLLLYNSYAERGHIWVRVQVGMGVGGDEEEGRGILVGFIIGL